MNNNLLHENQYGFQMNSSNELQHFSLHARLLKPLIMANLTVIRLGGGAKPPPPPPPAP